MKERLPLSLVIAGSVLVVTGTVLTVILIVHRDDCDGVSASAGCQGYTNSIHWTFPLILLGAAFFIAAGLSATNLVQRRHRKNESGRRGEAG
jgi:hypothetical protein